MGFKFKYISYYLWLVLCFITWQKVLGEELSDVEAALPEDTFTQATVADYPKNKNQALISNSDGLNKDVIQVTDSDESITSNKAEFPDNTDSIFNNKYDMCNITQPIQVSNNYYIPYVVILLAAPVLDKLVTEHGALAKYRTSVVWGGWVGLFIVGDIQHLIPQLKQAIQNKAMEYVVIPATIGIAIDVGAYAAGKNSAFMNYQPSYNPNLYSHLLWSHFIKNVVIAGSAKSTSKQDFMSSASVKVIIGTGSIFFARMMLDAIHLYHTSSVFVPVAFALSGGLQTGATMVLKQVAPSWVEFEEHDPTFRDLISSVVQSCIIGIAVLIPYKIPSLVKGMVYAHAKKND